MSEGILVLAAQRDLRRRLSHLAIDAHDQHRLAVHRQAGATKTFHCCDERHADPSSLFQ